MSWIIDVKKYWCPLKEANYSMIKFGNVIILIAFSAFVKVNACTCFEVTVDYEIENSEIVFIGVLKEVIIDSSLYYGNFEITDAAKYINFEVVSYSRGPWNFPDYVSVLDLGYGTSCSGRLENNNIGDTIVIFGNYAKAYERVDFGPAIIGVSICCSCKSPHSYSLEDQLFLDDLDWQKPNWLSERPDFQEKANNENQEFSFSKYFLKILLILSILVNSVLYWKIRKK